MGLNVVVPNTTRPYVDLDMPAYIRRLFQVRDSLIKAKGQDASANGTAMTTVMKFLKAVYIAQHTYAKDVMQTLYAMRRVCACRVQEGKYINDTLTSARHAIADIIKRKMSNRLRMMPAIPAGCASQLCDTLVPGGDCYDVDMDRTLSDDSTRLKSEIVRDYILGNKYNYGNVNIHDLKLVVFGLFNNNSNAVNVRPPQVYMSVNGLTAEYA